MTKKASRKKKTRAQYVAFLKQEYKEEVAGFVEQMMSSYDDYVADCEAADESHMTRREYRVACELEYVPFDEWAREYMTSFDKL